MRYKFRAYHNKKELLVDVLRICFINGTVTVPIETDDTDDYWWHSTIWNLEDVELMQFTGLTDVNGREIYEGDIVRIGNMFQENLNNRIGKVVFERGKYIFYENVIFKCDLDSMGMTHEVIGNIYQHKYLLKENEK